MSSRRSPGRGRLVCLSARSSQALGGDRSAGQGREWRQWGMCGAAVVSAWSPGGRQPLPGAPPGLVCEPVCPEACALWSAVRVCELGAGASRVRGAEPLHHLCPSISNAFLSFQISDIKDALASIYGVIPKVQCLPPKQVRCAVLFLLLCLSLSRRQAQCFQHRVPRGRDVCVHVCGSVCVRAYAVRA